jgi:succinoglycan biosynthesis protein ExoU
MAGVDVLIAAWNRADTIERAILSALAQEDVRAVIVVDDASTDDTAARSSRCDLSGKRVIVERLPTNVGPSVARNIAIRISKAPWLAVLDGDDFFLPDRINMLLSQAGNWDFVADNLLRVPEDQTKNLAVAPTLISALSKSRPLTLEEFVLGDLNRRSAPRKELGFLKPLIRRSFLDSHNLRYDEALRLGEDYALYARALAAGARFLVIPSAGYVSCERAASLSARHSREDLERLRDSDRQLLSIPTLTRNERRAVAMHYLSVDCRVQWRAVVEGYKARSVKDFLVPFCRSPRIAAYLLQELGSEFVWRTKRYLAACKREGRD